MDGDVRDILRSSSNEPAPPDEADRAPRDQPTPGVLKVRDLKL